MQHGRKSQSQQIEKTLAYVVRCEKSPKLPDFPRCSPIISRAVRRVMPSTSGATGSPNAHFKSGDW